MSSLATAAMQEVLDSHVLIEAWFRDTTQHASLVPLLNRFDPHFSMVTPKGATQTLSSLKAILQTLQGTKPDLKIQVRDQKIMYEDATSVILTYEEQHVFASTVSRRLSTAVFVAEGKDHVLWRHLHETWIE